MPQVDINIKRGYDAVIPVEKIWDKFETGIINKNFCVPLGENNKKEDVCLDLPSGLHIMAAGAALSGLGMFRRVALATLLKFNKPEDLQFILIDPLNISFFDFKNIDKHLIFPTITDNRKAIEALEWANDEVVRRFEIMAANKYMTIDCYNEKNPDNKLPHIVIMITELGELLDHGKNDAESLIVRIAMKAKCVGIHLILSTQRPTKDVITGLIFANTPTKIAFQTGSKEGSLAILFRGGAEKLLGQGDMIIESHNSAKPQRVQGYYLSEDEICKMVF